MSSRGRRNTLQFKSVSMAEAQADFLKRNTLQQPGGHFVFFTVKRKLSLSSLHPASLSNPTGRR